MRPYARLLTMLGEQLIKNDRIALVELIKNCYDADATRVVISFEDFGPGLTVTSESRIVITDNGDGMTRPTVENHWLNPATNVKAAQKSEGRAKTPGGRVIQGEKGIGRFAMFKLGSVVNMTTRHRDSPTEVSASLDIRFLDPDDSGSGDDAPEFLDQLEADVSERKPEVFVGAETSGGHGTRVEIADLRGRWSSTMLEDLQQDVVRLRPLGGLLTGRAGEDPLAFEVEYLVNGSAPKTLADEDTLLQGLVPRAVLRVVGSFDARKQELELVVNDEEEAVPVASEDFRGLDLYRRLVSKAQQVHEFVCGDFAFEFLVFDLRPSAEVRFKLDPGQKELVRSHRIYLYRDGVRVLPYGDRDDDWLQLDVIRGTQGANRLLSNDQTIGFIYITQADNNRLQDKTNREGLIDSGPAYNDFRHLLQLLINYLRKGDFARYLAQSRQRIEAEDRRKVSAIEGRIIQVRELVAGVPGARAAFDEFEAAYEVERKVLYERVDRTEDLAGVGLSVETASHDVIASANQAWREAGILAEQIGYEYGRNTEVFTRANGLSESLSFIVSRLQDVQGLFVSSRQKAKKLDAVQYVRKIQSIYSRSLREANIEVLYEGDNSVVYTTHEATLLQIFLNLMDNSIYWLRLSNCENPQVTVTADAEAQTVTFTDNGPGINELDVPYIFEPFFSAKGDEGRGLGLYISSQIARRDGLELTLVGGDAEAGRVRACFRLKLDPG